MTDPDVAFFLPSLRGGGAERVMMDLARAAAERGKRVDVVILNRSGAVADDLGSTVRIVDLGARRAATALPALVTYLRRTRPRSLLSTLEHTNVLAILATRLVRVPRVVLREANTPTHDLAGEGAKERLLRWAMRRAYRAADAVIAVSEGVAAALTAALDLPRERVHVVLNPVITPRVLAGRAGEADHPWFAATQPPVVLGVGRLVDQKGFDVLLDAFRRVRAARSCRLVVLGEGPLRAVLLDQARAYGVADDVALPGFVNDPFPFMARAGVFVLSSRWEGLPNVLIQALATGAQVVATDCPSGPREVLDGDRWGRLVPVDDAAAMAAAIEGALVAPRDPPPPAWARRYALEDVVDAYLALLDPDRALERT